MPPALKAWGLTNCTAMGVPPKTLSILTEDTSVVTWEQGGTGRGTRESLGGGKYDYYCDSFLRACLYHTYSVVCFKYAQFIVCQLYLSCVVFK